MNTQAMHNAMAGSLAGDLTFPQVVGMLAEAGVESYRVDFRTREDTFYLPDGRVHRESFALAESLAPEVLSVPALRDLIAGAQRDEIRYPEFVQRCIQTGVVAYQVFITGRMAIYFGRKGDLHTENFPPARS